MDGRRYRTVRQPGVNEIKTDDAVRFGKLLCQSEARTRKTEIGWGKREREGALRDSDKPNGCKTWMEKGKR